MLCKWGQKIVWLLSFFIIVLLWMALVFMLLSLWSHCELYSLISDINASSTGMIWVPLNMGRSAVHRQGIVREFHSVWRVVTLRLVLSIVLWIHMLTAYTSTLFSGSTWWVMSPCRRHASHCSASYCFLSSASKSIQITWFSCFNTNTCNNQQTKVTSWHTNVK